MKRAVILLALLVAAVVAVDAQSFVGTWSYKNPVGKVEGVDFGNKLANSMFQSMMRGALKKEFAHELDSIGVTRKNLSLVLNANGSFRMPAPGGVVSGIYKYNESTGALTLMARNGCTASGSMELSESKLTLYFALEELTDFMILVGSAKYGDTLSASALEEIRVLREESARELQQMNYELAHIGNRLREEDKEGQIGEENIDKLSDALSRMRMYAGLVFGH